MVLRQIEVDKGSWAARSPLGVRPLSSKQREAEPHVSPAIARCTRCVGEMHGEAPSPWIQRAPCLLLPSPMRELFAFACSGLRLHCAPPIFVNSSLRSSWTTPPRTSERRARQWGTGPAVVQRTLRRVASIDVTQRREAS